MWWCWGRGSSTGPSHQPVSTHCQVAATAEYLTSNVSYKNTLNCKVCFSSVLCIMFYGKNLSHFNWWDCIPAWRIYQTWPGGGSTGQLAVAARGRVWQHWEPQVRGSDNTSHVMCHKMTMPHFHKCHNGNLVKTSICKRLRNLKLRSIWEMIISITLVLWRHSSFMQQWAE